MRRPEDGPCRRVKSRVCGFRLATPVAFKRALDTLEQNGNNPPSLDRGERIMLRMVFEETLALASIALFLATIAVWAQVLGVVA
jgi:hypothetical protein